MKINILNYDCGNIWSVKNAFKFFNIEANIINNVNSIIESDCLILPGDGSFKIINDIKKKKFKIEGNRKKQLLIFNRYVDHILFGKII